MQIVITTHQLQEGRLIKQNISQQLRQQRI